MEGHQVICIGIIVAVAGVGGGVWIERNLPPKVPAVEAVVPAPDLSVRKADGKLWSIEEWNGHTYCIRVSSTAYCKKVLCPVHNPDCLNPKCIKTQEGK
jgi:hypothetical protein